jgi:hypothetical protein
MLLESVLRVPVVLELAFARGAAENRCTLQLEKPDKKPTWLGIKVGCAEKGTIIMATVSQGINFATKNCKAPYQSRFAPLLKLLTQGLAKFSRAPKS